MPKSTAYLATRRSLEGRGSKFDDCQLPIGQDVVKGLLDARRPTDDEPVNFLAVRHTEQEHLLVFLEALMDF